MLWFSVPVSMNLTVNINFVITKEHIPLFARFEAHYAVPLGRKKTAKAVNIVYEHANYTKYAIEILVLLQCNLVSRYIMNNSEESFGNG